MEGHFFGDWALFFALGYAYRGMADRHDFARAWDWLKRWRQ